VIGTTLEEERLIEAGHADAFKRLQEVNYSKKRYTNNGARQVPETPRLTFIRIPTLA